MTAVPTMPGHFRGAASSPVAHLIPRYTMYRVSIPQPTATPQAHHRVNEAINGLG